MLGLRSLVLDFLSALKPKVTEIRSRVALLVLATPSMTPAGYPEQNFMILRTTINTDSSIKLITVSVL